MDMQWWHWAVLGLILGLLELATPGGFFILFFGVGALLVGCCRWPGSGGRCGCSGCSSASSRSSSLFFFRDPLLRRMRARSTPLIDSLTSDVAIAKEDIQPGAVGRAELRGTAWSALNVGPAAVHRGQRCAVRKVDGLMLHICGRSLDVARADLHDRRRVRRPEITDISRHRRSLIRERTSDRRDRVLVFVVIVVAKTAVVVPQQSAYVVERLGRYHGTLDAGFHILVPFVDVIRYRHSLKETAIDIPEQICITRDNVQVEVDGVLYLKVLNPERASYGISDYLFAIIAAGADDAAQRGRQDRPRSHLRGAHQHQHRRSSASSTRPPSRGASRCCATRSRTSRRPPTSWPRWKSRCAPSARSAPSS